MMRVLMITSDWPDRTSWGGTATFIARQAQFVRAAGVEVDVFQFRGEKNPARYLRAWLEVRRRLRRNPYDLIHAQFGQSGLLALPKTLPLVVTFRGDDLQGVLHNKSGRLSPLGRTLPLLSRIVARQADATIVVSPHLKDFLPRGIEPHVIPSGVDFERFFLMPRAEARRHLGLPPDQKLVLFVGNPDLGRKRYGLARQVVDRVKASLPVELVLCWGVPHKDIPYFMNACDALLFTSLQEGSPNAVKEALACNLPVVSVTVGDVPERLRGIEGCAVCADDRLETLAAALERVLRRGERIDGRGALRELDENVITERVIGVYRSIVARRVPVSAPARDRSVMLI